MFRDVIILGIVALAAAGALFYMHRRRKAGKSLYCSGCALKGVCQKKDDPAKN